jgi:hypothetical protein
VSEQAPEETPAVVVQAQAATASAAVPDQEDRPEDQED